MKKTLILSAAVIFFIVVSAQTPQKISYQAVVRNNSGQLITNTTIGIQISILQDSLTGTPVYSETQTPTTNENGLVTIEFGGGKGFDTINWASGTYFLKTGIDPDGGANYTAIQGISQLLSVPYALHAKTAENGFSGDYNELTNKPNISDSLNNYAVLLTGDQIIAGEKVFTGTVIGTINANNAIVSNVATPVQDQDAVNKAYVDSLNTKISEMETIASGVWDINGNHYNVVKIGSQIWMKENLRATKFNDSTDIPYVSDNTEWSSLSTPGYCLYSNASTYYYPYGFLYNWYAVNTSKLCPTGWHVPSDAEWTVLTDYIGGDSLAGIRLKETGTSHWETPNSFATNEYEFNALPGAGRLSDGNYTGINRYGNWWTSESYDTESAWGREMAYNDNSINRGYPSNKVGVSVRCIKD